MLTSSALFAFSEIGSRFPVSLFFLLCLLIAAMEYVVQSVPRNTTSAFLNSFGISSIVSSPISQCNELGNLSSQSTVNHSCPLFLNSLEIHSNPLNNSITFIIQSSKNMCYDIYCPSVADCLVLCSLFYWSIAAIPNWKCL